MSRLFDVLAPKDSREERKERAMARDDLIGALANRRRARHFVINPEWPAAAASQRAKDRFGAAPNFSARFDEMDRLFELVVGKFGELLRHTWRLEWKVFNLIACALLPAADPAPAEVAVAVKDQQRLLRGPGNSRNGIHASSCNPKRREYGGFLSN